jgi:hypothetical protein
MQPPDSASPHPIDELIVRLIRDQIDPSPEDVQRIVDRMASAPFNQRAVRVPGLDRGLSYGGIVIGRLADPLALNLAKRVEQDEQWADGTTTEGYLADLRRAVQHPRARILVYERSADYVSATISPTIEVVPDHRRGERLLPHLLVVYSATFGNIRTGYMYSDFSTLNMPEAIRWLR